ncbi:Histone-lysine N-methyltransferase, H3 lysine-79 specific [Hondaea fermentalgiana]|uniref:Histone-lysine N-methyltransferase, H3 lysine-79 specific n=1 Tax=Hondaea fermentalgiana TaxID=2315210 RepID=A0A2R5G370_9STRA|nr:Histone-lysine N-methyltransferase, H3 lysine-79 specific [Hondaea fermentalgiana]|eukprot:GBG24769.1 Histone-lysine N-methyltransferase, H3 lysine-79 specific [Hondaea fermentalgiana]
MPRTRRTARREALAASSPSTTKDGLQTSSSVRITKQVTIVETKTSGTTTTVAAAKTQSTLTKSSKSTTKAPARGTLRKSRVASVASGVATAFKSPRKTKPSRRQAKPEAASKATVTESGPSSPRKNAQTRTVAAPATPERKPASTSSSSASKTFSSPEQYRVRKSLTGAGTPLHASPITPGRKKNLTASLRKSTLPQSSAKKSAVKTRLAAPGPQPTASSSTDEYQELDRKIHLKMLYSLIRRKTGALGGGGAGGAIYGEVTQESFQRVVDVLVAQCGLNTESVFLDIGAGLGKPNFHVAISPGVKQSLGVELIGGRWWQSVYLLDQCLSERTLRPYASKVFFAHANVTDMKEFEPTTHVYSFNRGFPPEAMEAVARAFHASSTAEFFICFDKPKVLEGYGFRIELVDFVPTKMAGSGEQHRCYVYRRTDRRHLRGKQETSTSASTAADSSAAATSSSPASHLQALANAPALVNKGTKPRGKAPRSPALFALARTPIRTRAYNKLKKTPRRASSESSGSSSSGGSVSASSDEDEEEAGAGLTAKALNFDNVDDDQGSEDVNTLGNKVESKMTLNAARSDVFTLVPPPKDIDYAPHVPHSDSYMQGLELMSSSVLLYQSWVRDQIGLHRSDRASRSSSRRLGQR